MTTDQDPVFLTHKQLCNRWSVSTMFLHRMRRSNKLKAYRLGVSCIRYKFTEILAIESALKTGIPAE
jgi:hypothetical protein